MLLREVAPCSIALDLFLLNEATFITQLEGKETTTFYFSPCSKYIVQYLIEDKGDCYFIVSRNIFMGKQLNARLFKKAYVIEIERFLNWEALEPV